MDGHGGAGCTVKGPQLLGGILTFFPSYSAMESVTERWTQTGLMEKLKNMIGGVIVEPKGSAMVSSSFPSKAFPVKNNITSQWKSNFVNNNSSTVRSDNTNSDNTNDGSVNTVIQEFEKILKERGRCLLLAVCRGKVSEGIDFKDNKGRIAIITGIPFVPPNDPWVSLKKEYLDERSAWIKVSNQQQQLMNVQQRQNIPTESLNGSSWYLQSASRAVNQALGRVIRHRHDWGAVLLLDDRFQADRQKSQLSGWVKSRVRNFNQFSDSLDNVRRFLTVAMEDPKLAVKVYYIYVYNSIIKATKYV